MADISLRGGKKTSDPRMDWVYPGVERHLPSLNFLVSEAPDVKRRLGKAPRSYTWPLKAVLDQGNEGACVGFGYAAELMAKPQVVAGITNQYARERLYWEIQKIDPWEGGSYPGADPQSEGTSVLFGAKLLKSLGYYSEYRWAVTLEEMVYGVGFGGPMVIGVDWYDGMYEPDNDGYLHPTGPVVGGHCALVPGVSIRFFDGAQRTWQGVDPYNSHFILQNSWSETWGENGRAKIRLTEFKDILVPGGEFCLPIRSKKFQRSVA